MYQKRNNSSWSTDGFSWHLHKILNSCGCFYDNKYKFFNTYIFFYVTNWTHLNTYYRINNQFTGYLHIISCKEKIYTITNRRCLHCELITIYSNCQPIKAQNTCSVSSRKRTVPKLVKLQQSLTTLFAERVFSKFRYIFFPVCS